jgi:NADH-ubiquinone oxidoreductase chain 2
MNTNNLLILIVAIAIPSFQNKLSPVLFTWLYFILFIYTGVLIYNALYIESLGSVVDINSGLWYVS